MHTGSKTTQQLNNSAIHNLISVTTSSKMPHGQQGMQHTAANLLCQLYKWQTTLTSEDTFKTSAASTVQSWAPSLLNKRMQILCQCTKAALLISTGTDFNACKQRLFNAAHCHGGRGCQQVA
jgi:hypothetical protein